MDVPASENHGLAKQWWYRPAAWLVLQLFALLAVCASVLVWRHDEPGYGPVFWLWVAGVFLFVLAFPRAPAGRSLAFPPLLGLLALLVWAATWRIPGIYDMPANISIDELLPGVESMRIAAGQAPNVFGSVGWFTIPNLAFAPAALSMLVLPFPPFHSLRLASAATGLVGIAFTVGLGRELFGSMAGWIGGFLMSVAYWHLHNSRTGFPFAQSSLAVAAVTYLLLRALRRRDLRGLAVAGVCGGLALHLYFPARAVLLVAPWVFLHGCRRFALCRREALFAGAVFVTAGAIVVAPLLANVGWETWAQRSAAVLVVSDAALQRRAEYWGVEGFWGVLHKQVSTAFGMFTEWADLAVLHRSPWGLLDPVTLALALLGAFLAVLSANGAALTLLLWFLLVFVLGVVLTDAPRASYRLAPAMPAILLLAAFALSTLWSSAGPAKNGFHRVVRAVLLAVLLGAIAAVNARLFFVVYPRKDGKQVAMSEAVRYASRHCRERHFRIVPARASWPRDTLPLFCERLAPASPHEDLPPGGKPVTLLLVENWGWYQRQVEERFPQARIWPHAARDGRILFFSAEIAREAWESDRQRSWLLGTRDWYRP